jgi:D-2-hydroxyacid dehydrogenase (NADP+)
LTTRLLLLLNLPKEIQAQYHQRLTTEFPQLLVHLAGHHSEPGPSISSTDILVTFAPMLTDQLVRKAENLKWVQALGTGVDNLIDLPSLRSNVIITNIHGIHGAAMSEAAIMAMLALSRNFPRIVRNQAQHEWQRWPAALLESKTVGIFGVGAIGEALAPRCKALRMTVVGISSAKRAVTNFDQMYARNELANAVSELDYLIVLTPYSSETRNIVNSGIFSAMKRSAYFINLSRGGVVDESALIDALERELIAGAALDVFSEEPLPPDHPFWSMKNVIVMPHLAGFNDQYAEQALPVVVENIRRFLVGDFTNMLNIVRRGDELA